MRLGAEEKTLYGLFLRSASTAPDELALIDGAVSLSYGTLARRAEGWGRWLRPQGVGPDVPVALSAGRGADALAALLGVLAAGGACLPLDPSYPAERLSFMLEDAGVALGIGPRPAFETPGVSWIDAAATPAEADDGALDGAHGESLAYILYTSGSTGRPKGVGMPHRPLVNLLRWQAQASRSGPGDRTLQFAPSSFDVSFQEIFATWSVGGTLVLVDEATRRDPAALLDHLAKHRVQRLFLPFVALHWLAEEAGERPRPLALEEVVTAGEQLRVNDTVRRFFDGLPGCRLENQYGPTEAHVVTAFPLPGEARGWPALPAIGEAIDEVDIHLSDDAGGRAQEQGELLIGGQAPARGYLGRPALTAERFVPDPFSGRAGGRLYRTGDLARRAEVGGFEFLGRLDGQVKVRGFRVEVGEVEAALEDDPRVRAGAVKAVAGARQQRLVAYLVAAAEHSSRDLVAPLRQRLPDYMVPSAVVRLEALPLTPSGKVDRRALPVPDWRRDSLEGELVAPRDEREATIAAIWCEVLGLEEVGVEDDFFALGGHSLVATRLAARMGRALGREVELAALFEERTIAALARRFAGPAEAGSDSYPELIPRSAEEAPRHSFAQRRLWFLDRLDPQSTAYNVPLAVRLPTMASPAAVAAALGAIVARHRVLRTTFPEDESLGERRDVLETLPEIDLTALPPDCGAEEERRAARWLVGEPFDLAAGPLLRAALLHSAAGRTLFLVQHHIITDGWSLEVLVGELKQLLQGAALPALGLQYDDYAAWQRRWLAGERRRRLLARWRRRLADLEPLELPTDRRRNALPGGRGAVWRFPFPEDLGKGLVAFAEGRGETPFMVLLAVFQACLGRWTGRRDLAVGSPVAGRRRPELEGLLGFFVNTLVLRAELPPEAAFADLLTATRRRSLAAFADQDLPFEELVEALAPVRDLRQTPLVQVLFVLQNLPRPALELSPLGELAEDAVPAKLDLTFEVEQVGDRFRGRFEYRPELFDEVTMRRWAEAYLRLLSAGVEAPDQRLAELPLLSPAQRHQLLHELATAPVAPSPRTYPELVRRWVDATPDALAWSDGVEQQSFADLWRLSGRMARQLRRHGIGRESLVALVLSGGAPWAISALAVWRAGGAFVPVDPAYPAERIAWMMEDSGARWAIATGAVEAFAGEVFSFADLCRSVPPQEIEDSPTTVDDLAYVIYTSGSTGRPKGTQVSHRGLGAFAAEMAQHFAAQPGARVLQMASPSFDASVAELLMSWASGATLVFAPAEERLPGRNLEALLSRRQISHLTVPPSALAAMDPAALPGLSTVLVAGEACPPETARRWASGRCFVNAYGPTETTICASFEVVAGPPKAAQRPPIGRPLAGFRARVLDAGLRPVPLGSPGELYLAGTALARGYLDRPRRTAESFRPDPWGQGERLYRTGDLVRWLPAGGLDFLGRADDQVKVRGFRVELGEVEARLTALPALADGAVVAVGEGDRRRLVAYAVPHREAMPEEAEEARLRAELAARLPAFMVPSRILLRDHLPRTPNGKLDRRALARQPLERAAESATGSGPRTVSEAALVEIWQELLELETVDVAASFFDLGGHSLLATRMLGRVRQHFGVDLPVAELFEEPTVVGLARRLEAAPPTALGQPLRPLPEDAAIPASSAQQRLWFLDELSPGDPSYNIPLALTLEGAVDGAALAAAWNALRRRHRVLRTVFQEDDGRPWQRVVAWSRQTVPEVSLVALPESRRRREALRLATAEAERPFDLRSGPLARVLLLRLADQRHELLINQHHSVSDGASTAILLADLRHLYGLATGADGPPLPPLELHYGDYAAWQQERLAATDLADSLAWWRRQLAALPPLELPFDRPRPAIPETASRHCAVTIPEDLRVAIETRAQALGVTPFMVLAAALSAFLGRLTGRRRPAFGTPVSGRDRPELDGLLGFFVNTLVLVPDLAAADTGEAFLRAVGRLVLEAHRHREVPFDRLVEELAPERDPGRSPLFQVMFALRDEELASPPWAGALEVAGRTLDSGREKFDLTLMVATGDGPWEAQWSWRRCLFDDTTVQRWGRQWLRLLSALVHQPATPVQRLPLLSAGQRHQVLREWNDRARRPLEGDSLLALVERWVRDHPQAVAVVEGDLSLTYGELDRRSASLARELLRRGLEPAERVAILWPRSADWVVAMLAVVKAGGAYVPLDPAHPETMLRFFLQDAGCRWLIADTTPTWSSGRQAVLTSDEIRRLVAEPSPGAPTLPAPPGAPSLPAPPGGDDLLYVMYTSGSTGRPKGVMVTHRGVDRLVRENRFLALGPGDRMAQGSNVSFDAATLEIWGALVAGATLVVLEPDVTLSPARLQRALQDHQVTSLFLTTALLHEVAREAPETLAGLEHVLTGGEGLDPALSWKLLALGAAAPEVINGYGPTETTTYASTESLAGSLPVTPVVGGGGARAATPHHNHQPDRAAGPRGAARARRHGGAGRA
ncbi:MAG: amino acid adenylation domain-containing protein, partial [Acidobacteriota bacterium]